MFAKMGRKALNTEGRRIREKYERESKELEENLTQKNFYDTVIELKQENKVPVHLDEKTTLWVDQKKCYQDEEGKWHKIPKKIEE